MRSNFNKLESKLNETLDKEDSSTDRQSLRTTTATTASEENRKTYTKSILSTTPSASRESYQTNAAFVVANASLAQDRSLPVSTTQPLTELFSSLHDTSTSVSFATNDTTSSANTSSVSSTTAAPPESSTITETTTINRSLAPSTKTPLTSKIVHASSDYHPGAQFMPLFLYDRFASLSQQIGLLEERIGHCEYLCGFVM